MPDASQPDDGRRVAAFAVDWEIAPGEERQLALVFGQAQDREGALSAAARASLAEVKAALVATRLAWSRRLANVRVRTNRPDFDRLVNTWLPYQTMAARRCAVSYAKRGYSASLACAVHPRGRKRPSRWTTRP